jgi:predicted AAA+ superfamily ATPase
MFKRNITESILSALADTPAVVLQGPRQCGKTTLVKALASEPQTSKYFTLDDFSTSRL